MENLYILEPEDIIFLRNLLNADLNDIPNRNIENLLSDNTKKLDSSFSKKNFRLSAESNDSAKKEESKLSKNKKEKIYKSTNKYNFHIKKNNKINNSIKKIYDICSDSKNNNIIDFYTEGGIIIYNIKDFENKIIKKHYESIKIDSFYRMLYSYGFLKKSIIEDKKIKKIIFNNINFQRNCIEKLYNLQCCKNYSKKIKSLEN